MKWHCSKCSQSSSRNWNIKKHIERRHDGIGQPMQEPKLSSGDDIGQFFSHNQNLIADNSDGYPFQSQGPNDRQYDYDQFSQFRYQTKGETPTKRTSTMREFIKLYRPIIQEHREFQEIVSYLRKQFIPPTHPQLTIADNGMYNISVNNSTGSNNILSSNPPVGFRSIICAQCLTGLVEAVLLSDFERIGPASFKVEHVCKQEDLQKLKHFSEKHYIDMTQWNELRGKVTKYLFNIVHQWVGLGKEVCLSAIEVPTHIFRLEYSKEKSNSNKPDRVEEIQLKYSRPWIEGSYISLEKLDENHWAYRTLYEDKLNKTMIDNNEFLEFLNLAKSTFAPFQAEADGRLRRFYICISSK
jgi:hypothetical protein